MSAPAWQIAYDAMVAKAEEKVWARWVADPFRRVWLAYKPTSEAEDGRLIVVSEGEELETGAFYVHPEPIPHGERYQLANWFRGRCGRLEILPLEGRAA